MTEKIVILGAGAIGRGYLPWVLDPHYDLIFVDSNSDIIAAMKERGRYLSYRVRGEELEEREIRVAKAYTPDEFNPVSHADVVACFFSVGPRSVPKAAALFRGTRIPLILCENEPNTVTVAKKIVGHDRVYFAVPDVITSNTSPEHLLRRDPLSVVTEDGELFVEKGIRDLQGKIIFLTTEDLLRTQWTAKLYLHNTPHCIAAYLGALVGARFVHEAMQVAEVNAVVAGAMDEMLKSLKLKWDIPHEFLQWYADKELARFRSKLLFDPVSRVAREPLRKLEVHGRLIGAAQICLALGIIPTNILAGITGALLFENKADPDHHLVFLRKSLPTELFNTYILGLRPGEPLDLILRERIDATMHFLEALPRFSKL